MYCCFRRDLHLAWRRLKDTADADSPAENKRIGMETIPKERVPVPMVRAGMESF
jgi:hypothetical protein